MAILGEAYRKHPPIFAKHSDGSAAGSCSSATPEDFADYARWLWRADILPVMSHHDFFGASVVQAIYCNCTPLLPRRLAYPEHLPAALHGRLLYDDRDDLLRRLREMLKDPPDHSDELQAHVAHYDWRELVETYDDLFERMVNGSGMPGI